MAKVTCPLEKNALNAPHAIALRTPEHNISWALLKLVVDRVILELENANIDPGEILALSTASKLTTTILLLACIKRAVILCPLNPGLKTTQIRAISKDIGVNHHLGPDESQLKVIEQIIVTTLSSNSLNSKNLNDKAELPMNQGPVTWLDLDSAATLVMTSGSSGSPKAVLHSLANHYYSACGSAKLIPLSHTDSWWLSLPLFHVGGLAIIFRCLFSAATMVLDDSKDILKVLSQYPITHASMVPTQVIRLLKMLSEKPQGLSLSTILIGGAAVPSSVVEACKNLPWQVYDSYGLTEMSSQVATKPISESGFRQPLAYRQWRLVNGEIQVRGKTLCLGYVTQGKLTQPFQDGWFATKDLARTEDGKIHLVGRLDNMFICGGENYQPEAIEQELLTHPDVIQAIIVPIKDDTFGHIACALIDCKNNALWQQINDYLQQRIAKIYVPKHFLPWPENTGTGIKINRKVLQQYAEQTLINTRL
ncbi:o-succinylbenzoate--CoA ligase [Thalassotalea aquiviva]|uniref:o-succinylbenzoate--CoA ligase n=1 Tax=Thalassotalea aquiviva TaxID=3242415 RepID=UPI00352A0B52